jgi:cell wall-associated NlpC family hydrolase
MSDIRQCIAREAETWVDTPFRANQKVKGVGVDCIGLVAGVFEACGIAVDYRDDYSIRPDGTLRGELQKRFAIVTDKSLCVGDVLLMSFEADPHHVALYVGDGFIVHAYAQARRCVKQRYSAYWRESTKGVFRHASLA